MKAAWIQKVGKFPEILFNSLFQVEIQKDLRWLRGLWLAGLYALGFSWFGALFEWGNHPLNFEDWSLIAGPRLQFFTNAMRTLQLPLHISSAAAMHDFTTRYLSVPDTIFSPQLVLLRWNEIGPFDLRNVLLLYTLGFVGLLFLASRFRLSVISFAVLFLLFNFNGHVVAHYSVGHDSWGGYFLFPWFAWLVFRLLDGEHTWTWTLGMAVLMFVIWLQGSYHQYIYLLIFLGVVGIFIPRTFWTVIRTGVFTIFLSAFRILPAALLNLNYSGPFTNGYPIVYSLWDALVVPYGPGTDHFYQSGLGDGIGAHEVTLFIGLIGALFLVYFGIYRGLIARQAPFRKLTLPLMVMLILAMGWVFGALRSIPIPLIQGERVSTRILSVVLLFGFIFTADRFQRWLDETQDRSYFRAVSLPVVLLMGFDLWQNLNVWRLSNAIARFEKIYYNPDLWFVANDYTDTLYFGMIGAGLAITLLTFGILLVLARRERRRKISAEQSTSS